MLPLRSFRPARLLALGALALLVHAAAARAAAAQAGADEKAVAAYRLSMPALRKAGQATERMLELVLRDQGLARELEERARKEGGGGDTQTIADIVAAYDEMPKLKGAITGTGLTVREFIVMQLAMMQAALVVGFQDPENTGKEITIPDGVSKENVAFVRANWAELQRMGARAQQLQKELEARSRPADAEDEEPTDEEPTDEEPAAEPARR
jgi:hypothetical protein